MKTAARLDLPLRVGVFASVEGAERAVEELLKAGFSVDQVSVLCTDRAAEDHFRTFEHEEPAGTYTPAALVAGSTIGMMLGGGTALLAAAATGGAALLVAGGISAWAGGVVGGFIGAMLTRGAEKEAANFYDQAVQSGKLLVVADEEHSPEKLRRAEQILAEAGAEPLALTGG